MSCSWRVFTKLVVPFLYEYIDGVNKGLAHYGHFLRTIIDGLLNVMFIASIDQIGGSVSIYRCDY